MKRTIPWSALSFAPVVVGLALSAIPDTAGAGLLMVLAWPLPVIVLGVRRGLVPAARCALVMMGVLVGEVYILIPPDESRGCFEVGWAAFVFILFMGSALIALTTAIVLAAVARSRRRKLTQCPAPDDQTNDHTG